MAVNNWLPSAGWDENAGGYITGFIATDNGTCTKIKYPGAKSTMVGGINDLGTLTGTFWPRAGDYPYHGFLTDGSTFTQIDYPAAKSTSLSQSTTTGGL